MKDQRCDVCGKPATHSRAELRELPPASNADGSPRSQWEATGVVRHWCSEHAPKERRSVPDFKSEAELQAIRSVALQVGPGKIVEGQMG